MANAVTEGARPAPPARISTSVSYADLQGEIAGQWDAMIPVPERAGSVSSVARGMLAHKARYVAVSIKTGVPWPVIAIIHHRESGGDWGTHLHNGDPLRARTFHVPAGRPKAPPANGRSYAWEESAVDALLFDGLGKVADWTLERALYQLEVYNGFGPRRRGCASGYVWAGTNIYRGGKYVRDGVWSSTTWDQQLGCAPLLARLMELDPSINLPRAAATTRPVPPAGADVRTYQMKLIALGYDLGPAGADGDVGPKTQAAVKAFQAAHGLEADGIVGPATRDALDAALAAATAKTSADLAKKPAPPPPKPAPAAPKPSVKPADAVAPAGAGAAAAAGAHQAGLPVWAVVLIGLGVAAAAFLIVHIRR